MFENKTKDMMTKYNESIKLIKKLQDITEIYQCGKDKHDAVFYNCIPRVYSLSSLEYDMHCALSNILKNYGIHRIGRDTRALYNYGSDNLTIKEHIKAINGITIKDFYYNAFYAGVYNDLHDYPNGQSFKDNVFEDTKAHESQMYIILNCIYLLDNAEPIGNELKRTISNELKNSNTFIFKGCKVTLYNNGRLIIKFSSSDLYNRFKNATNNAIKQIKKDLQSNESEA